MEQVVATAEGEDGGSIIIMRLPPAVMVFVGVMLAYAAYYLLALVSRIDLRFDKDHQGTAALLRRCSLLKGNYWPSPWIFSGHLDVRGQTFLILFIIYDNSYFHVFYLTFLRI
jgi:hypothetical protein